MTTTTTTTMINVCYVSHDFGSSARDVLRVVTQSITNALPVPMLRQVYVEPWKVPLWAPPGPPGTPEKYDFAWEVCKKWEVGDVNSTS